MMANHKRKHRDKNIFEIDSQACGQQEIYSFLQTSLFAVKCGCSSLKLLMNFDEFRLKHF